MYQTYGLRVDMPKLYSRSICWYTRTFIYSRNDLVKTQIPNLAIWEFRNNKLDGSGIMATSYTYIDQKWSKCGMCSLVWGIFKYHIVTGYNKYFCNFSKLGIGDQLELTEQIMWQRRMIWWTNGEWRRNWKPFAKF